MESRDVLKIHSALRRYCTSRVSLRSTLEVQYLLNLPCIFNTSLDSMLYLLITYIYYFRCIPDLPLELNQLEHDETMDWFQYENVYLENVSYQ